jgi:hypothetical protein
MAKKKSKLKKALAIGAGLAGALALAKGRGMKGNVSRTAAMEDANRGESWYNHPFDRIPFADHTTTSPRFNLSFKHGGSAKRGVGIAKRGFGRALKGK